VQRIICNKLNTSRLPATLACSLIGKLACRSPVWTLAQRNKPKTCLQVPRLDFSGKNGRGVIGKCLIHSILRIILCAFCAEDYLQQVEYQPVICHPCLSPQWKTCRKVPCLDPGAKKWAKTCRKVPRLDFSGKNGRGVIGKCLSHSLLRIILCAKSAEDYLQQVEYQPITCHPCLSPHWETCLQVPCLDPDAKKRAENLPEGPLSGPWHKETGATKSGVEGRRACSAG